MSPNVHIRLLAGAAVSVVSLAATFVGPAAAHNAARLCPHANTPVTSAPLAEMKTAVVCLVNQQRAAHGLPALTQNNRLNRSAQIWTNTMVATKSYSHGSDFSARITSVGYHWSAAGENIATGFSTPATVVDGWMGSLGHCQNILAPDYSAVGTGLIPTTRSAYGSNFATWTQDFALPMGAQAPSHNTGPAAGCPYTVTGN